MWWDPEGVSLPLDGLAASADILAMLPRQIHGTYIVERGIIRPACQRKFMETAPCSVGNADNGKLVEKL